jgi:Tol biopolymer transport system component
MTWFDRAGKPVGSIGEPQRYGQVALSRDGRYAAYSVIPRQNIWMFDVARGVKTRLTFASAPEVAPLWSPDGTRIVYSSNRSGRSVDLYLKDLRNGAEQPLVISNRDKRANSWSRDGQTIFYSETDPSPTKGDISYFSFVDHKPHACIAGPASEGWPQISPDGKWIAYVSNENPSANVYLAPFPPTGAKWQVSTKLGSRLRWRGDGKELYFDSLSNIWAVPITLSATPDIGQATALFSIHFAGSPTWDVTADGQKFLINSPVGKAPPPAPLTLVQHFDTELRHAEERRE